MKCCRRYSALQKKTSQLNIVFCRRITQKFCMLSIFRSLKTRIILSSPSSWQLLLPSHPRNTTKGCAASPSCFWLFYSAMWERSTRMRGNKLRRKKKKKKGAGGEGRLLTLTIIHNIIFDLYMKLSGRQRRCRSESRNNNVHLIVLTAWWSMTLTFYQCIFRG